MGTACTCTCNQDSGTVVTSEAEHPAPSRPSRQDNAEVETELLISNSQFDPLVGTQDLKLHVITEEFTQESTTDDLTDQALKEVAEEEKHPRPSPKKSPSCSQEFTEEIKDDEQDKKPSRSIDLVFDVNGTQITVQALHRPLGLLFERSVPLTVKSFAIDSHGQSIGICRDWVFKSVDGEDMAGARTYQEAKAILARHVSTLPLDETKPGATILFVDVDGAEQSFRVMYQPLGLMYEKQLPLKVLSCREKSYGTLLGIQPGYILKSVNGQLISKTSYDDANDLLKRHLSGLPKFVA